MAPRFAYNEWMSLALPSPRLMGVINATPDSFYPASRGVDLEGGLARAMTLVEEGADILDIGGESSRPGSNYLKASEERRRVIPLIKAIRRRSGIPISVDTRKGEVARAALEAGANIINDISALTDDPSLKKLAAEAGVPVVLMHKRGSPANMQDNPSYEDPVEEVLEELLEAAAQALKGGVQPEKIILDPGIGFGKRQQDNLALFKGIPRLKEAGYPLLIGASRKSFIGNITGKPVGERLIGSVAVNFYAALRGADILRVHDVAETLEALRILSALEEA